jgi:hypothetical protein
MVKQKNDDLNNNEEEAEEISVPEELSNNELFDKDEEDSDDIEAIVDKEPEMTAEEEETNEDSNSSVSEKEEISQTPDFIKNELSEAAAEIDEMDDMDTSENAENSTAKQEDDFSYLFTNEAPAGEKGYSAMPEAVHEKQPEPEVNIEDEEEPDSTEEEDKSEEQEEISPQNNEPEQVTENTESAYDDEENIFTEDDDIDDEFQAIISASASEGDNDSGYYMFGSKKDDFAVADTNIEAKIKAEQEAAAYCPVVSHEQPHPPMGVVFAESAPSSGEKTSFTYGFGDGETLFVNKDGLGTIKFNNPGKHGIEAWKLILSETKIIPLFDMAGMTIELPKSNTVRGTLVGKNGETISIFNAEKFIIPVDSDASIAEANPNAIITGDFNVENLEVWNLVLTDTRVLSFADIEISQEIELPKGSSMNGSLIGPENHILNFFGVEKIIVNLPKENSETLPTDITDKGEPKFKNMFEGITANNSNKPVFMFSESMGSKIFEGNDDKSVIEVITGPDGAYGWNIIFTNGVRMGMHDLLKYQSKYGSMPDSSGKLFRGRSSLEFTKVTRIYTYTKPTYSGYLYGIPAL